MPSLRRGRASPPCIVPSLTDDTRRESIHAMCFVEFLKPPQLRGQLVEGAHLGLPGRAFLSAIEEATIDSFGLFTVVVGTTLVRNY